MSFSCPLCRDCHGCTGACTMTMNAPARAMDVEIHTADTCRYIDSRYGAVTVTVDHHRLGWVPSVPDHRDQRWTPDLRDFRAQPVVDLRNTPYLAWPTLNQGNLGSCTANAISGAIQTQELKQKEPQEAPSRLFIYYAERAMEGTIPTDSGAQIRDGMKVVNRLGYVPETMWPYDVEKFATAPPADVFLAARKTRVLRYQRLQQDVQHLKAWLAAGHPFVAGITVASSFPMQPAPGLKPGYVPMPQLWDQVIGGHALLWVGYSDIVTIGRSQGAFIFRNSWGDGWGDDGYGYLPYEYLTNPDLAQDFWGITLES